jgi:hypothetical protein
MQIQRLSKYVRVLTNAKIVMINRSIKVMFQNKTNTTGITIRFLLFVMITFLAISPTKTYAQAVPNVGSMVNFTIFTSVGALANTGISPITGNIGTNNGAVTNYNNVSGTIEQANTVTAQGVSDVQALYNELANLTVTAPAHTPVYGSTGGETLFAGVYDNGGAGSIGGTLILDAQGDPNALFVFTFPGGAFTTAASAEVILTNGAQASNVFWTSGGAIGMAAGTKMKGTLISNPGAVSMAANGELEGRMLSTSGAMSTDNCTLVGVGASTAGTAGPDADSDGIPDANDSCPNTTAAQAASSGFIGDCTASPTTCGCTDVDGDGYFPDAVNPSTTYDGDDNDPAIPGSGGSGGCTVVAPTLSGN